MADEISRLRTFRSFYSKLSVTLILAFIVVACVLLFFTQRLTSNFQNEVEQKLHVNLAEHIVHDNQLLNNGEIDKKALKHAFHSMMILGPSFEFYIIEKDGRISTYSAEDGKVKRKHIALAPLQEFIGGKTLFPIMGDDPRSQSRQKIFSVAQIEDEGELVAYLYIIIGGEIYDGVTDLLSGSHLTQLSLWALSAMLLFTLAVMLTTFFLLTRPLRQLTEDVKNYTQQGFDNSENSFKRWQGQSQDEVTLLGQHFAIMADELNKQYQKVRTTDELRRELISYVSHDLRTPLSSLQGYLETWRLKHHELEADDSAQLIAIALKNAQQMSRLVEQLFELAHLDGDNVAIDKEPVAIAELAQDVIQKMSLQAGDKSVSMDVEPKDSSIMVMADIEKLERVFHNLLDNALRHCSSGDAIRITFQVQEQATLISISDTGCGIADDELPYIFDAHYRASNSASGKSVNSGLGLAICQRIIELHDASITVSSELKKGTVFSFSLARHE